MKKEGDGRPGYPYAEPANLTGVFMQSCANLVDLGIEGMKNLTEVGLEAQRKWWDMAVAIYTPQPRELRSAEIIDFKNHPLVQKKLRRENIVQKETPAEIIFLSEFHK